MLSHLYIGARWMDGRMEGWMDGLASISTLDLLFYRVSHDTGQLRIIQAPGPWGLDISRLLDAAKHTVGRGSFFILRFSSYHNSREFLMFSIIKVIFSLSP